MAESMVETIIREGARTLGWHDLWDLALDTYIDLCATNGVRTDTYLALLIDRTVRSSLGQVAVQ